MMNIQLTQLNELSHRPNESQPWVRTWISGESQTAPWFSYWTTLWRAHYGDCQFFEMCVGSLVCRRTRSRLMFWSSAQVYSFGLGRDSTMAHIAWMSVGAFTTIHALPTEQIWDQFWRLVVDVSVDQSTVCSDTWLCAYQLLDCVRTNYLTMCVPITWLCAYQLLDYVRTNYLIVCVPITWLCVYQLLDYVHCSLLNSSSCSLSGSANFPSSKQPTLYR